MFAQCNCNKKCLGVITFVCLVFTLQVQVAHTQVCVDDYFNINLNTSTVQNVVATISTPENEIIATGNVFRSNSLLQGGWLTRYSAQGTILWSRQYYTRAFNFLNFTSIIAADNGNYLITGNIGDVDTTVWPLAHLSEYGVLLKVDKYGNVLWSKILSNRIRQFEFSNIINIDKTKEEDFILSINSFSVRQYVVVMRINKEGNVIWTSILNSPSVNTGFGDARLKVLSNGNIIFGGSASVMDEDHPYQRKGYYFNCLDSKTGTILWNKFFLGRDTLNLSQAFLGDIVNITELPDRTISFITSYAASAVQSGLRKTDKVLNFFIDESGILKKVISYANSLPPIYVSSVAESGNGNRLLLMDDGDAPYLVNINAQGTLVWQKAYALIGRGQETKSILHTGAGNYWFCNTNNGGSRDPKLIKTDNEGNIPCVETAAALFQEDITGAFFMQGLSIKFDQTPGSFGNLSIPGVYNYTMQSSSSCRIACCSDITDTANEIKLCDISYYVLPNKDTVRNSGIYTTTYKTTKGCDSIVYQSVVFNFTPVAKLGADTCLGDRDSLVLKAVPGYNTYTWNGFNTSNDKYVVKQPGDYTLQIKNECGVQADTVTIFKECQFEIFMPNAFTPNRDGLNDLFKIPAQNHNSLVSFSVYDRWGKKVFETRNITEGWNGMNKEYPAPAGTYIYVIVMKSLDNKTTFTKKGWVVLIR